MNVGAHRPANRVVTGARAGWTQRACPAYSLAGSRPWHVIVDSTRASGGRDMRISVSLAVAASVSGVRRSRARAGAARPVRDDARPSEAAPAAAPAPAQIPVQQPIDPYSAYPAPPAYGYQAPAAGPPATPSPPSYQQGYYLYPSRQARRRSTTRRRRPAVAAAAQQQRLRLSLWLPRPASRKKLGRRAPLLARRARRLPRR